MIRDEGFDVLIKRYSFIYLLLVVTIFMSVSVKYWTIQLRLKLLQKKIKIRHAQHANPLKRTYLQTRGKV